MHSLAIFLPLTPLLEPTPERQKSKVQFLFWHNYHLRFRQGTRCGNGLLPGSHFPFVHSHPVGTAHLPWITGAQNTALPALPALPPELPETLLPFSTPGHLCASSEAKGSTLMAVFFLNRSSGMLGACNQRHLSKKRNGVCGKLST